jgi:hypothetical protein
MHFIDRVLCGQMQGSLTGHATLSLVNAARHLEWESQYSIRFDRTTKYPDIVLLADQHPLIILENKVGAGFTAHGVAVDDGEQVRAKHQLEVYGEWLAAINPSGALVLLTHWTEPPSDFLISPAYGVRLRCVTTWTDVYQWLRRLEETCSLVPTGALAAEFRAFLEEKDMAVDDPDVTDLALAQAYHRLTHTKLTKAFEHVRDFIRKQIPDAKGFSTMNVHDTGRTIWGWCYPGTPYSASWWIGWGIRFPDGRPAGWYPSVVPSWPQTAHAFVGVGSDKKDLELASIPAEIRTPGWAWATESNGFQGAFRWTTLAELSGAPTGFTAAFEQWLEQALPEARGILAQAFQQK